MQRRLGEQRTLSSDLCANENTNSAAGLPTSAWETEKHNALGTRMQQRNYKYYIAFQLQYHIPKWTNL
eukprot:6471665-Amphidinium_carterae.1